MASRLRLSPVDTAWLRMDTPGNLMMIVGVQFFDRILDAPLLRALLQTHLCVHRQFCARVELRPTGAWWVPTQVDLDHHLIRMALPGKAGTAELQRLIAQLAGQSLDATKPLWQMHLIENYRAYAGAPKTSALIVRIHHCIADGIALIRLLFSMTSTDAERAAEAPHQWVTSEGAHSSVTGADSFIEHLIGQTTRATVAAISAVGDVVASGLAGARFAVEHPEQVGQQAAQVGKDVAAMALMARDSTTELKGHPSGVKAVAWHRPLPLDQVKSVGKAIGCSVNDVLLSCAAGAFRAYLMRQGEGLEGAHIRALVPVNLRRDDGANQVHRLGNQFGLVPVLLPVGEPDPLKRTQQLKRQMNALKGGYMPLIAMALLGATGMAPRAVQQSVLSTLAHKATAVITNVPGPRIPLYMAGAKLNNMMFWVPQAGDIGVGVSILSYDGQVQFGLMTDKHMCQNPSAITEHFGLAFDELARAVQGLATEQPRAVQQQSKVKKTTRGHGDDDSTFKRKPVHKRTIRGRGDSARQRVSKSITSGAARRGK